MARDRLSERRGEPSAPFREKATSEAPPGLSIRGLSRPGLAPVDLDVPAGACVSIDGPSGAGKTLLLRAIADLDPNEGEVFLDGTERALMPAPR